MRQRRLQSEAENSGAPVRKPDASETPRAGETEKPNERSHRESPRPQTHTASSSTASTPVPAPAPTATEKPAPVSPSVQKPTSAPAARPRRTETTAVPERPPRRVPANDPLTTGTRSRRIEAERKRVRRRRRNAKIRTALILIGVVALIAGCVYLAWGAISKGNQPEPEALDFPGPGSGSVEVVVNPGDSGAIIGTNLMDAGVVKTQAAFLTAWNDNQAAASIQPGTYTLKKEMRAVDALSALLDDSNRTSNAITVPPGFTAAQISERLAAFGKFTTEDVEAAMKDSEGMGLPEHADGNPEGWLAPGTYEVHSDEKPVDVLKRMVQATITELQELNVPEEDWHTVLTKASILEMEVNIDQYLPMVARVIDNRLTETDASTVGLLNMDSTVLYGLGRSGGIPSYADTEIDTPYNTYMHKGLPPTPIASPSRKAVEATLKPAEGDWLYFVTVNLDTGETKFARTIEEHEANKQELLAWCAENEGKC